MKTRNKTTVIDFSGSSCSGKSHVKDELQKRLSRDYGCTDLSGYRLTAKDCLGFILGSPKPCAASLALILYSVPAGCMAAFRLTKKWFTIQIKLRKAALAKTDFVLLDEGFFKWLGNIRAGSVRKITLDRIPSPLRKNLLYPGIAVFVDTDFDTIQARKKLRGLAPHRKNEKTVGTFVRNREMRLRDMISAEKAGFIKTLLYDNSGEFDASLVEKIKKFHS